MVKGKVADQINIVREQMRANFSNKPEAKKMVPMEERGRIAEENISKTSHDAAPDSSKLAQETNAPAVAAQSPDRTVQSVLLELLDDSIHQNRLTYPELEIEALSLTMKDGQLQPLRVVKKEGGRFEILAGHRRKRAAQLLEWTVIDCIVVERTLVEAALDVIVDNETHQGLGDFERAKGYRHLISLGVSQADLARQIGVDRSLISHRMRFFSLPAPILATLEKSPSCMSYLWVPKLLAILNKFPTLVDFAVQGLEKVALGKELGGWEMGTLISELARKAATSDGLSGRISKTDRLSVTNEDNIQVMTVQKDAVRPGVYEIRLSDPKLFDSEAFTHVLAEHLKTLSLEPVAKT